MTIRTFSCWLLLAAMAVMPRSLFAQCELPKGSMNMCNPSMNTTVSNTGTNITLNNAGAIPPTGSCTVKLSYYDESIAACGPEINCTGTISSSGSTINIALGGCFVWPDLSSTAIFSLNVTTPSGIYYYHVYNFACDFVLPIHISTWDVQRIQTSSQYAIKVTWTADIEDNASHVIIERNSVANQYEFEFEIGRVNVDHSSSPPHSYEFIDYYPLNGTNWYRLKLVDIDGHVEYITPKSESCPNCQYSAPWIDCSSYVINGPHNLCSGTAFYSFSYPAPLYYNKYNWSVSDWYGSLNSTKSPTVAMTQQGNGDLYLNLSVSRCSPATRNKSTWVQVGKPPVTGQFYPGSSTGSYENLVRDNMGTNYTPPGYVWVYPSFNGTQASWDFKWGTVSTWNASGSNLQFVMPNGGDATFEITYLSEHCGWTSEMFTFQDGGWGFSSYYNLSPNPATSQLRLSVDDGKLNKMNMKPSAEQAIQQVIVFDKFGNTVLQQKFAPNTRSISLGISGLKPDVYTIRIFNGKKWESRKFIKQ